ncbi:hypothetical protein [Planctobacterium marinum]|uniref:hypothetical protein n=1 Tax=Planctobacterium marinum TaxID=1631968 RepID=UPI001E483211|nr:hypothetical protein [Planctobacterium marinum]MCC2608008.1 hypothetical protein [Planctobacterium marinum]
MDPEILNLITTSIALFTEVFAVVGIISKRNANRSGFSHSYLNAIDIKIYKVLFISASWALMVMVWALTTNYFGSAVMKSELRTFYGILLSVPAAIISVYALKWLFSDNTKKF